MVQKLNHLSYSILNILIEYLFFIENELNVIELKCEFYNYKNLKVFESKKNSI